MFSFEFKDEGGNRLSVPGDVTVEVPSSELQNSTDPVSLWSMSPETGRWEYLSDFSAQEGSTGKRKRRQSLGYRGTLHGIQYSRVWYNFDSIRSTACYSKVRVFKTSAYNEINQLTTATTITVFSHGSFTSVSRYRARTDKGYKNGFCILHPCDSPRSSRRYGYKATIFADQGDIRFFPADPAVDNGISQTVRDDLKYSVTNDGYGIHIVTDLRRSPNGPLFDWTGRLPGKGWTEGSSCSNSPFSNNHFRFSENKCESSFDAVPYTRNAKTRCIDLYYLLWYSVTSHEIRSKDYVTCYIKVYTPSHSKAQIKATSRVANKRSKSNLGDPGSVFGSREDCSDEDVKVTCVEVKGPTDIGCSVLAQDKVSETETALSVVAKDNAGAALKVTAINTDMLQTYGVDIRQGLTFEEFRMSLRSEDYGPRFGIYWGKGKDPGNARKDGRNKCLSGSHTGSSANDRKVDGWAIQFG